MSNNLVPKVSITEAVSSLATPQDNLVTIGIIWTSQSGTANTVYAISSVSQADAIFGTNYANSAYLMPMIRRAFAEGASSVKAVSIGQPTVKHTAALTADAAAGSDSIEVASLVVPASNEVQLLTPVDIADGGTYTITVGAKTTAAIAFGASAGTITTALSTATIDTVTCVGTMLTTMTLTYSGAMAGSAQPLFTVNVASLTKLGVRVIAPIITRVHAGNSIGTLVTTGDVVYVGTGSTYQFEERRVVLTAASTTIKFTEPLTFKHYLGETASNVTEHESTDYAAAITAMEADEGKSIVVCELNDDATALLIANMCKNSYNNYNTPCVYFRGAELADTEITVADKAVAMNSDRGFMIYPLLTDFNGKTVTGGEVAAATAGLISGNGVPRLNHNFSEFSGFGGVTAKIADMDGLLSAGVMPIELKYNSIHIVRFVTTWTLLNGIPDYTRQEGAVRLNVDYIEKAVSKMLQTSYLQKGNTSGVRTAISVAVSGLLTKYTTMDILVADALTNTPAFSTPQVTTDANDRTKVNVDVSVSPGRPLNFINLNFKIYL